MTRYFLILLVIAGVLTAACGRGLGGGSKVTVKTAGTSVTADVRSGGVSYGNIISTAPGKPQVQTFSHSIYIANYEMDMTNGATMQKPLTAVDQVRVQFTLQGEEGTKDDSPFKPGEYRLKAERFNRIGAVRIWTFVDGKEKQTSFDAMSSSSKAEGFVRIIDVGADSVSGEIDLTEGDNSVKGTFTAKLPVKK